MSSQNTNNESILVTLEQRQSEFDDALDSYNANMAGMTNALNMPNGDTSYTYTTSAKQSQDAIAQMSVLLMEMKRLLDTAYNMGEQNQYKSDIASSTLSTQAYLIDAKYKVYQDALQKFNYAVGAENETGLRASQQRNIYILYMAIAVGLVIFIWYVLGGGYVSPIFLWLLIAIGVYLVWTLYKSWLAGALDVVSPGGSRVRGVFRLIT